MRWIWDERKNEANKQNHQGLGFEIAQFVFDDPLADTRPDIYPDEEREQTIGQVGNTIILVVHTKPHPDATGEETGRIISARKATRHERRAYEEGNYS